ncbi:MAG: LrgB family protein [Sandarakinorhabdus sp.]|nr:LrgB family protein [Sandarakinorhabdus sp.]
MLDMVIGCAAVLLAFAGARPLSARLGHPPWASPVLLTALVMVAGLGVTKVPLARFDAATAPLSWLLGPALTALALVIDANRQRLRAQAGPVLAAVVGGTLIGLGSAVGMARLVGIDGVLRQALVTKTVTTPFTVAIMTRVGGPVALAAALSVLTGVVGALLVPVVFQRLRIDGAAQALGIGVSSHIVGTDWLTRRDSAAGGLSALAFVLAGLVMAMVVPLLWDLLA